MARAVQFDEYGDVDVLQVRDVADPQPGERYVQVRVRAAGINPGEAAIRTGALDAMFPATFPSGQGSDFAGEIAAVGAGVTDRAVGDEVIGFCNERASHAEYVTVPVENLTPKPGAVPFEVAGALFVAGAAAVASVRAVEPANGETVLVSGAAGGVGVIAAQLAVLREARVIGVASEANHDFLRSLGVEPLAYGDGLTDAVRELAPDGLDAVIDTFGAGYVAVACGLGVPAERINTISDFAAVSGYGVRNEGTASAGEASTLAELAGLIVAGRLTLPVAATYPLQEVREAFRELEHRHTRGKIVLVP